jgi:hypothetical protein
LEELAAVLLRGEEGFQLQAKGGAAHLLRAADAEVEDLLFLRLAEDDDAVRAAGQGALDAEEELRLPPGEVAVEDVAVVRVDHGRDTRQPRGDAAEGARLGEVRVNQVRPEAPDLPPEAEESGAVTLEGDLPPEAGDLRERDAPLRGQALHRALVRTYAADHQARLEPRVLQALGQVDGLVRRTADVQAGDDPHDAESVIVWWRQGSSPRRHRGHGEARRDAERLRGEYAEGRGREGVGCWRFELRWLAGLQGGGGAVTALKGPTPHC